MIGLTGSHRCGKTTLAREFSERYEIPFLQTSASAIFKELGLDPAETYPFDVRLSVQREILQRFTDCYAQYAEADFITDRTPLDMLAYTLADVGQEPLSPELEAQLDDYIADCFAATNRFFSIIVLIQPGIPIVAEPGKASLSKHYINHVDMLTKGAVYDERLKCRKVYMPSRITDLDNRVTALGNSVRKLIEQHDQQVKHAKVIYH